MQQNHDNTGHLLYISPCGMIEAEYDDEAVVALRFVDTPTRHPGSEAVGDDIHSLRSWLDTFFSGTQPAVVPPLRPRGTPFQKTVWKALATIPFGSTVTYGDIARSVGCRSPQAVGQAVGSNPIALIIPCHRVVGTGGKLTGYAYGIDRKKALLDLERRQLATFITTGNYAEKQITITTDNGVTALDHIQPSHQATTLKNK